MGGPEHARLRRQLVLYSLLGLGAALVAIPVILMAVALHEPLTTPGLVVIELPAAALFLFAAVNAAKTRRRLRDLDPPTARSLD